MSELTREQFVEQVCAHVKSKFPLVKIAIGEEPFTVRINGALVTLENVYRLASLQPDEQLHHIDRWIVEILRASEGTPDRFDSLDELRERIMPMVLSSSAENQYASIASTPLIDGLMVAYAIDQDRTISYIPKDRVKDWELSMDDLHELAVQNLVNRSESLAAQAAEDEDGNVNLILFQTMDSYDASRILLPTLHEKLRPYLGSPFGAAIPNRDMLLCFRNDAETVGRLEQQVKVDFQQMPHSVTAQLLLVTADGIAVRS